MNVWIWLQESFPMIEIVTENINFYFPLILFYKMIMEMAETFLANNTAIACTCIFVSILLTYRESQFIFFIWVLCMLYSVLFWERCKKVSWMFHVHITCFFHIFLLPWFFEIYFIVIFIFTVWTCFQKMMARSQARRAGLSKNLGDVTNKENAGISGTTRNRLKQINSMYSGKFSFI